MSLKLHGYTDLPAHTRPGGFDHAAVHSGLARLYVAHTSNDAVDVVDCSAGRYLHSIANLTGVAGALVAEQENLLFTSNRGENTVGILPLENGAELARVPVGLRPNGLAYSPAHQLLLAANVGDPHQPGSHTVSLVDVARKVRLAEVEVPGRTRWTVYDAEADVFYVNIADPAQVVVIEAADPTRIARAYRIPAAGPHGLDLDAQQQRLFCACDAHRLISLEAGTGAVLNELQLGGGPDVIFFNPALRHLYVASGVPGIIEVVDTDAWRRIEIVTTEKGAHTLAFDAGRNKVYAFLPETHRAAVYVDGEV
jgi:DNA-binding beta-propeller fold protein YncE